MKVESVRTHLLEHSLAEPFLNSFSGFTHRVHCLVEVTRDDGTVGWGECLGPARLNAATVAELAPHVVGRNPLDT